MADFYKWDPKTLGLEIKEMDDEHIILIKKMNMLHQAYTEKKPKNIMEQHLTDFATYTIKHFSDEEAYMEKIKFEGIVTHKIIHKKLLEKINEFVDKFNQTGSLTDEFFTFLSLWLTSHIKGIDFKYANKA